MKMNASMLLVITFLLKHASDQSILVGEISELNSSYILRSGGLNDV